MLKSFTTLKKSDVTSIAIGGFDGIHIAHKELLANLDENGALVVIDRGGVGLTPHEHRCRYTYKGCFLVSLEDIRDMSASSFVKFLQDEFRSLKKIVVGYDFRFAKDREGDSRVLKELFDGEVVVVDEITKDGISVHSRVIKDMLKLHDLNSVKTLLGREYSISAKVIKGQGIGKKELFATLNLNIGEFFLPANGVYATYSKINGINYKSVTFIGNRVSTDGSFSVETHILNHQLNDDISSVEVTFVEFIRDNLKFDSLSDLKVQIQKDIDKANSLLL
jgi:riboflavin kinase/FMN adenylyltransferase